MDIVVGVILALALTVGAAVAVVVTLHRKQQQKLSRDNQLLPGRPTSAPRSWAVSHDPEARLHRRLRDAMTALHSTTFLDTGTTVVLRADLEQTAFELDDYLVAVSRLPPVHREELLQKITATVECIESAVARYAAAATLPDTSLLEADLAAVQHQLDITSELQRRLLSQ